jgi:hypothetical protein
MANNQGMVGLIFEALKMEEITEWEGPDELETGDAGGQETLG